MTIDSNDESMIDITRYMDFSEYQQGAALYAVYPRLLVFTDESGKAVSIYPFIGLADECGEVLGKVKRVMRDAQDTGVITESMRKQIAIELGDVLWYVAMCAHELNIPLRVIAHDNLAKLQDRQDRNVLKGSGDNR